MSGEEQPIEVLLVEDSAADVRLTLEAFKEARIRNRIHVAEDGESALAFLRDPSQRTPDLVLLDLNLPGIDGREVLSEIRADERLAALPVVVMTTSKAEEDVLRAYRLHCNCYIIKPLDLDQFLHVVSSLQDFWLTVVKLPPRGVS